MMVWLAGCRRRLPQCPRCVSSRRVGRLPQLCRTVARSLLCAARSLGIAACPSAARLPWLRPCPSLLAPLASL
eukprot:6941021-Alexandrium_andersonii.AAC.1